MESGRVVFRTKWFEVEELDDGSGSEPYYRLRGQDAVVIFAITEDREVILVRQNRPARGHATLEIPAGGIEVDETPIQAVQRELREETGFIPRELYFLGTGGLKLDRDSTTLHGFLVFGASRITGCVPEVGIETVLMPLPEFVEFLRSGSFEQLGAAGFVLRALLRFASRFPEFLEGTSFSNEGGAAIKT